MWLPSDQPQHQMPPVTHTHTCAGLHSEKTSCCLPTCPAILTQILGLKHYLAQADTGRSVHCRYTPVANRCFAHHTIASLRQVGMAGRTPLLCK